MVGEQVVRDLVLVDGASGIGCECAGCGDRLAGEPARQQGLPDPLAGQHVGGGGGVAHEQHTAVGERDVVDAFDGRDLGDEVGQART